MARLLLRHVDLSLIQKRALAGETLVELAKEFNVSYAALHKRCTREKWGLRHRPCLTSIQLSNGSQVAIERSQLAQLVTNDSQEFIDLASRSARRILAELTLQRIFALRDKASTDQIPLSQLAKLIAAASQLFGWKVSDLSLAANRLKNNSQLGHPPPWFAELPTANPPTPNPPPP